MPPELLTSTTKDPNELLRPKELAPESRHPVSTIYRWCREGILPHIRITQRSYLIRRRDWNAFLDSKTV